MRLIGVRQTLIMTVYRSTCLLNKLLGWQGAFALEHSDEKVVATP